MLMKILSWNVRGLSSIDWRAIVKQLLKMQKVAVVLLQESKINSREDEVVKDIWGNKFVKWVALKARGSSGDIFLL